MSARNVREAELTAIFAKSAQNFKSLVVKHRLSRNLGAASKESYKSKRAKDENKENLRKQKLVIPKNIINFQPKEQAEVDKPKATIVRKVYVKRSQEFVKKIAERSAEDIKLKKIIFKVNDALNGLETRANEHAKNDESKEILKGGQSEQTSIR